MFICFFALWTPNGRWTTEIALFGLVSARLRSFAWKYMGYSRRWMRRSFAPASAIRTAWCLVREFVKAKPDRGGMILRQDFEPAPAVQFDVPL